MPGIFNFTGNCFPVSKKRSAGIRQGTFFIESQKSCAVKTERANLCDQHGVCASRSVLLGTERTVTISI